METILIYIYLFVAFAIALLFFKAFSTEGRGNSFLAALWAMLMILILLVAFGYAVVSAARLIF